VASIFAQCALGLFAGTISVVWMYPVPQRFVARYALQQIKPPDADSNFQIFQTRGKG
jgi:hypothetical protein